MGHTKGLPGWEHPHSLCIGFHIWRPFPPPSPGRQGLRLPARGLGPPYTAALGTGSLCFPALCPSVLTLRASGSLFAQWPWLRPGFVLSSLIFLFVKTENDSFALKFCNQC